MNKVALRKILVAEGLLKLSNVYPQCSDKDGASKVSCLVNAIMGDGIPDTLKSKRLTYLIALNKKHKWTSDSSVKTSVHKALERLK